MVLDLGEEPLALFDGQKLKKCGDIVHPISKITFWMKNKSKPLTFTSSHK